jgi:hypothetical protein
LATLREYFHEREPSTVISAVRSSSICFSYSDVGTSPRMSLRMSSRCQARRTSARSARRWVTAASLITQPCSPASIALKGTATAPPSSACSSATYQRLTPSKATKA